MLNLSRVVTNPRFAEPYAVLRQTGQWVHGVWTETSQEIAFYGVVKPASSKDLEQVPEGDRVTGAITLHSIQQMFTTRTLGPQDPNAGTSDIVLWHGQQWRVQHTWEWEDFGYSKAMAVRMAGE